MRRSFRGFGWGVVLLLLPTVARAGDAGGAEKEQKAGAQKTFDAGSKLYDAHQYGEALVAFRASYQIVPSPNSHLMIARALRDLGRNVEAYVEYDAVAREASAKGDRYESAAHAATEERDEVRPKVALLTVKVAGDPAGVTVKIGDAALDAGQLGTPIPRDPGAVVVTAAGADGARARSEVTLAAGGASDVLLTLEAAPVEAPPPEAPPPPVVVTAPKTSGVPLRTWAYVSGGVGVVGLATFGIFGAMSSSKYNSLNSSCPDHRCPADKQSDVDAGRSDQTIANVALVIGVVGVGAGVTLFVVSMHGSKETTAATQNVRVAAGPGSLVVNGRF
jgi:hypothetical protein